MNGDRTNPAVAALDDLELERIASRGWPGLCNEWLGGLLLRAPSTNGPALHRITSTATTVPPASPDAGRGRAHAPLIGDDRSGGG
jgi:hypothetical protein